MITTHTTFTSLPALNITPRPQNLAKRLVAWLIAKDQAFKADAHFKTLDDAALKDVGLRS